MNVKIIVGLLLLMAEQVGVQSGARIGIHNHQNISQGGILNLYSQFVGFRVPSNVGGCAISCTNNTEKSQVTVGYELLKETLINTGQLGTYRIYFEMRNTDNFTVVSARFLVNGVNVGPIETNNTNVYAGKTHLYNVDLNDGDLLQIVGDSNGDVIWIRNFRISYDWRIEHFSDGTTRLLVAPLALSDVDLLDFTNTLT